MENDIVVAVLIILTISFVLSLFSLRGLKKDQKVIKEVKKELSKGRVVYSNKTAQK
ncbi:MAG: hypothetical protein Q7R53_02690 [bacterium]|nr:hypothetical protein [bacterium]